MVCCALQPTLCTRQKQFDNAKVPLAACKRSKQTIAPMHISCPEIIVEMAMGRSNEMINRLAPMLGRLLCSRS